MSDNDSSKDSFSKSHAASDNLKNILKFDDDAKLCKILEKLENVDASELLQTLCLRNDNAGEILDELDKINEKQLNKAMLIQDKIINQIIDYKSNVNFDKISQESEEDSEEENELEDAISELQDQDHDKASMDFQKLLNLVVIFLRDKHIGNIKKLITNVEKDQYDLKALARIGEFTGLIAHVVRNPLANILITADILKSKLDADDPKLSYVETIISEIEKLETKIEDMVNYKDIKDIKDIRAEDIDIREIISIVIADLQRKFDKGNINVTTSFTDDIPRIPMLATKIEEAILNILQNMIDALPGGGDISIAAYVRYGEEKNAGGSIVIVMEDTGDGIPPEHLNHIMDPCFTTKKDGMGLGLYMTRKFVGDHGGNLTVENKPTKGARFTITLPIKSGLHV